MLVSDPRDESMMRSMISPVSQGTSDERARSIQRNPSGSDSSAIRASAGTACSLRGNTCRMPCGLRDRQSRWASKAFPVQRPVQAPLPEAPRRAQGRRGGRRLRKQQAFSWVSERARREGARPVILAAGALSKHRAGAWQVPEDVDEIDASSQTETKKGNARGGAKRR